PAAALPPMPALPPPPPRPAAPVVPPLPAGPVIVPAVPPAPTEPPVPGPPPVFPAAPLEPPAWPPEPGSPPETDSFVEQAAKATATTHAVMTADKLRVRRGRNILTRIPGRWILDRVAVEGLHMQRGVGPGLTVQRRSRRRRRRARRGRGGRAQMPTEAAQRL